MRRLRPSDAYPWPSGGGFPGDDITCIKEGAVRAGLELDQLADEVAFAHLLERVFDVVESDPAVDQRVDR
jgi:hypothetical protein